MTKGRVHVIISGYVQGVFFRASTRDMAQRFQLNGWVRNLPDGNVEALFEGTVENLHRAVEWCRTGPPGARVVEVKEKWEDYQGDFKGFEVRYT